MAVSRDVKCPVCHAEPRQNCTNDMGEDMDRMCHLSRWFELQKTYKPTRKNMGREGNDL